MFIRCFGKVAKEPYIMPYTDGRVYTLEELCYNIYNNIYSITDDFFNNSLVAWLKDMADHPVLAKKLETMIANHSSLKDLAITVLCACDYYKEEEIKEIIHILDDIASLPIHEKKKIRADNFMRVGHYAKALIEYHKLLNGSYAVNFSTESYGNILHNQGIAHFYTASFDEALRDFKEAYVRNRRAESLRHYLILLLIQGKDEEFEKECVVNGMNAAQMENLKSVYMEAYEKGKSRAVLGGNVGKYKDELRKAVSGAI